MSASSAAQRGGAPVGLLEDLGPVEAGTVLYLRLWSDGTAARRRPGATDAQLLPEDAAACFEDLCRLCLRYGRRPLMRHHIDCGCVGADESCFANFVACATEGDREDAMLLASLLVRPDMAPSLCALAQTFGLALRRLSLAPMPTGPVPSRLH